MESKYLKWIITSIIVLISFFWIKSMIVNYSSSSKNNKNKIETRSSSVGSGTYTQPDTSNKYPVLKKGKVIRIYVPSGYSYTCSGGGKMYYHQAQNTSKPQIVGNGSYLDVGKHVAYFDLSYYNEEITVVCEFKKM